MLKLHNIHLFTDDTVMYAIAPPVDQVLSELQSHFVVLKKCPGWFKTCTYCGQD